MHMKRLHGVYRRIFLVVGRPVMKLWDLNSFCWLLLKCSVKGSQIVLFVIMRPGFLFFYFCIYGLASWVASLPVDVCT